MDQKLNKRVQHFLAWREMIRPQAALRPQAARRVARRPPAARRPMGGKVESEFET